MIDAKIAFREVGEGPLLIVLHGYAGSVLHWNPVVEELKSHYRVIIPNLTHLYSGKTQWTFSQQIEILAEFIQTYFPRQKAHWAGISYGGALLWGMALKHPELVDKTIFINPMPPAPVEHFRIPILKSFFRLPMNLQSIYMVLRTPMGRFFLRRAAQVFRTEKTDFLGRIDSLHGRKLLLVCHVIYKFAWIVKSENWGLWKSRLESWTAPSLLIYDSEDPLFEPKTYHRFQDLIGCDFVYELENAGHIAIEKQGVKIAGLIFTYLSDPQRFQSRIA
jgi:pimeloyl-ACP methyl ester carboxylesterase